MKKIWIITELFYPEETSTAYILTEIANSIADDIDVHVICCKESPYSVRKNEGKKCDSNKLNPRIKVHRIETKKSNKNKLSSRLLGLLSSTYKFSAFLWKNISKNDDIFIVTNPAPLLLSVSLIKKIRKNNLYILVHDIFPENTIPANVLKSKKSLIYGLLKFFFNRSYRQANYLIALGRDMKDVLNQKLGRNIHNTKIVIIENWADIEGIFPLNRTKAPKEQTCIDIQYAGNLGRLQGLLSFLERVKEAGNKNIRMTFWGNGAVENEMHDYIKSNSISNVLFKGPYKREEQCSILNDCDISLITLAKGMKGLGVPSKTYNILSAGKPILYIGDLNSEVALLIKEYDIGYCFDVDDKAGVCDFLKSLDSSFLSNFKIKGERARNVAEKLYSKKVILNKYNQLIISNKTDF